MLLDEKHKETHPLDQLFLSPRWWGMPDAVPGVVLELAAELLSMPFPAAVLLPCSPNLAGAPSLALSHHSSERQGFRQNSMHVG